MLTMRINCCRHWKMAVLLETEHITATRR
jgi:hypothetical protein